MSFLLPLNLVSFFLVLVRVFVANFFSLFSSYINFCIRIAGGLGALLTWLPVKAYRPCPNFIDNGGDYKRAGQPLDEIAFGRDSTYK